MNLTPIPAREADDTDEQLMVDGDPLENVEINDLGDKILIVGYSNNTGDRVPYLVDPDHTIYLWSV